METLVLLAGLKRPNWCLCRQAAEDKYAGNFSVSLDGCDSLVLREIHCFNKVDKGFHYI